MGKKAAKQDGGAAASKVEGDQIAGDKTTTVEQPAPQAPAAPTGDHPGQGVHDASSAGTEQ